MIFGATAASCAAASLVDGFPWRLPTRRACFLDIAEFLVTDRLPEDPRSC